MKHSNYEYQYNNELSVYIWLKLAILMCEQCNNILYCPLVGQIPFSDLSSLLTMVFLLWFTLD